MTNKPTYAFLTFTALWALLWAACTPERQTCLTPKMANMTVTSLHKAKDTSTIYTDTSLTNAVFIPLTPTGTKSGILFSGNQSNFSLSLSPADTISRWLFRTNNAGVDTAVNKYDTITFTYARNLQFLSNACGFTYFFTLHSVHTSHYMIDSSGINNASVTNASNTPKHVQIYIHPGF